MNSERIDVHTFDKTLKEKINTTVDVHSKLKLFNHILDLIEEYGVYNNRDGLYMIVKDTQTSNNWDQINNMWADDILYEICKKIVSIHNKNNQKSIIICLLEQMSDMYDTGRCGVGRIIRLYQIYQSLGNLEGSDHSPS